MRLVPLAPIVAAITALAAVDVGMFSVSPGPAKDVMPLIEVRGHATYRPDGALLLTTVNLLRVDALSALRGWLDAAIDVVPERAIVSPGQTEEEYDEVARSQMDQSKIAAVILALRRLTDYPDDHGEGALVQDVLEGSAADGKLFAGDLIVAIDDVPVADVEQVSRAIRSSAGARALTLAIEAGGEERTVRIRPRHDPDEGRPILGVILVESFPFEVTIDSGDIGGPSAGLMWALGVYDLLTPGDLTRGRRIAGTGGVDLDGAVLPIGGIEQKIVAAERSKAEVFLVPAENFDAARAVAGDIELIPVRTVRQAIRSLERDAT